MAKDEQEVTPVKTKTAYTTRVATVSEVVQTPFGNVVVPAGTVIVKVGLQQFPLTPGAFTAMGV